MSFCSIKSSIKHSVWQQKNNTCIQELEKKKQSHAMCFRLRVPCWQHLSRSALHRVSHPSRLWLKQVDWATDLRIGSIIDRACFNCGPQSPSFWGCKLQPSLSVRVFTSWRLPYPFSHCGFLEATMELWESWILSELWKIPHKFLEVIFICPKQKVIRRHWAAHPISPQTQWDFWTDICRLQESCLSLERARSPATLLMGLLFSLEKAAWQFQGSH